MNPNGLLTFLTAKKSVDSYGPLPPFCILPQIPQIPNSVPPKFILCFIVANDRVTVIKLLYHYNHHVLNLWTSVEAPEDLGSVSDLPHN